MSARSRKNTTKKKAAGKAAKRTTTKSKVAKKKVAKKAAAKKTVKKAKAKKAAAKKTVKKTKAKKAAAKKTVKKTKAAAKKAVKKAKVVATKPAKKRPLSAAEKKERAKLRAEERKFVKVSQRRLLLRRAALIEAYHSAKVNTKASTAGGTEDYIDYAVSSYERDFSLSLTELERTQLLLVEEALGRTRRGEYGRCLNCAVTIPHRRLEVEAWARYCIACQELDDQGLLQEPIDQDTDNDEEGSDSDHDIEQDEEA